MTVNWFHSPHHPGPQRPHASPDAPRPAQPRASDASAYNQQVKLTIDGLWLIARHAVLPRLFTLQGDLQSTSPLVWWSISRPFPPSHFARSGSSQPKPMLPSSTVRFALLHIDVQILCPGRLRFVNNAIHEEVACQLRSIARNARQCTSDGALESGLIKLVFLDFELGGPLPSIFTEHVAGPIAFQPTTTGQKPINSVYFIIRIGVIASLPPSHNPPPVRTPTWIILPLNSLCASPIFRRRRIPHQPRSWSGQ